MPPGSVACGHCRGYHPTPSDVHACFERQKASAARATVSPVPPHLKAMAADAMREDPTPTEKLLGAALQGRLAFDLRQQVSVLGWTVDIYIAAARMVVEVDGDHRERGPADARRDEQMRAEGYTVVRVAASEVERDVEAVVRRIEARLPAGAGEEQRRLDEEAQVLLQEEIARQERERTLPVAAAAASRTSRVRAIVYSYVCTQCGHDFRSSEKPMPDCRGCRTSRHVRVACRCGAVAARGKYRCADCDVANEAAGPGARAYTGQMPRHSKRGRRI